MNPIAATADAAARGGSPPFGRWRLPFVVVAVALVDCILVVAAQDVRLAGALVLASILAVVHVKPMVAFALWFAAVPWFLPFRLDIAGPAADAERLVGLMLIAVALVYVLEGRAAPTARLAIPALVTAAIITVSTIVQPVHFPEDLSTYIDQILVPLGLALAFLAIPFERRQLVALLGVLTVTGVVAGGIGVYEHQILRNPWNQEVITEPLIRAQGPYTHPIVFAVMLGFAGLVLIETSLRARRGALRIAAVAGLSPVMLAIFFTFSRGPAVAFAVSVAFLFLRGRGFRWMRAEWLLVAGFGAIVLRQLLASEDAVSRYSSPDTLHVRMILYRLAWKLIEGNWFAGLGVAGFKHNVAEVRDSLPESLVTIHHGWQAVDNHFLSVLVEGGVVAGVTFAALIAVAARVAWRTSPTDPLQRIGVSFMVLVSVVSLDIETFHYAEIAACFFLGLRLAATPPGARV